MNSTDSAEWLLIAIIFLGVLYIPIKTLRQYGSMKRMAEAGAKTPITAVGSFLCFAGVICFLLWLLSDGRSPIAPVLLLLPGGVAIFIGTKLRK